jgi:hypothetical protein
MLSTGAAVIVTAHYGIPLFQLAVLVAILGKKQLLF